MSFRNFDNWDTYLDNNRKTLHGCVQFMLKDGSTVANIFDSDETPIANPQITDVNGRTGQQVFVNDEVRAYFYKYVGQGSLAEEEAQGIDTGDSSKWILQYTVESISIDEKEVEGTSAMGVANMDSLRALEPYEVPLIDGARVVALYGYYEAGDKEVVYYIWEEESEQPDNNGSVIQSDNALTGRWRMFQPTEHCDSRHFGIFPQDSASAAVDQATEIIQLVDYCNLVGLRPFFNGSTDYPYFIYGSLNVNSRNPIDVSNGTVFVDKNNSYMYGDFDVNSGFKFKNANTSIRSKEVRTAWNFKSCAGYEHVVIDAATQQQSFQNARVEVKVGTANKTFTNCEIFSDHKLGNNTFRKCKLTGSMIANNAQYTPTVDDTVSIDIDDFEDVALWLRLRDQQSGNIYDMHGRTVSRGTVNHDIYWINAVFDQYSVDAVSMATFEDCLGTVTVNAPTATVSVQDSILTLSFGANNMPALNVTDSSVVLPNDRATEVSSLAATGSNITGQSIAIHGDANLLDTQLNAPCVCSGVFAATKSVLNSVETYTPVLVGCDIYGTITQAAIASPIEFTIQECRFLSGNGHQLSSTVPNTVVNGRWVGNSSLLSGHFITIDRTNINPDEQVHGYVYEGNTGPAVLQKLKANWSDVINFGPDYSTGDAQGNFQSKAPYFNGGRFYYNGRMARNDASGGGHTLIDYYLTEFQMFTVGTQNIGFLSLKTTFPQHLTQSMAHTTQPVYNVPLMFQVVSNTCPVDEEERLWYSSNVGTPKGIMFYGGYTWRITAAQSMGQCSNVSIDHLNWTVPVKYELR